MPKDDSKRDKQEKRSIWKQLMDVLYISVLLVLSNSIAE